MFKVQSGPACGSEGDKKIYNSSVDDTSTMSNAVQVVYPETRTLPPPRSSVVGAG